LLGCRYLGCSPLVWLTGLGGVTLIGVGFGTIFGCFFGAANLEDCIHLYAEGVGWGGQVVAIIVESEQAAAQVVDILQREAANGVRLLKNVPSAALEPQVLAGNQAPQMPVQG
jgi:hypothetical protein